MKLLREFKEFLEEYKVIGLAIAFIIGVAATNLVRSLADNIIMPIVEPILPTEEWQAWVLDLGPFSFGTGAFLGELINFVIVAFVVFYIAKKVLKEEKVAKR